MEITSLGHCVCFLLTNQQDGTIINKQQTIVFPNVNWQSNGGHLYPGPGSNATPWTGRPGLRLTRPLRD